MEKTICVICGKQIIGYGNSPWPLADSGRCCDNCNSRVVTARFERLLLKEAESSASDAN